MIQATGDIGTQWILDLCNGIVKEGSIPVSRGCDFDRDSASSLSGQKLP